MLSCLCYPLQYRTSLSVKTLQPVHNVFLLEHVINTPNLSAVRCRGEDSSVEDGRCEHYFQSRVCLKCGADNAPSARSCRKCDAILIDPSKHLINKAYTEDDYKPVLSMKLSKNMSGNLTVTYELASKISIDGIEKDEIAKEFFQPTSKDRFHKGKWWKFVCDHIQGESSRRIFAYGNSPDEIIDKQKC